MAKMIIWENTNLFETKEEMINDIAEKLSQYIDLTHNEPGEYSFVQKWEFKAGKSGQMHWFHTYKLTKEE